LIDTNQNSNTAQFLFQKSLELFPDLVFLISSDGIYVDYKGSNVTLHIPPEEFLGKKIEDIMPKNIAELQMSAIKKTIATQQTQSLEFILPSREKTFIYEYRMVYLNNNRIAAYVRDITERKLIEQNLKNSEEKFKAIYYDSPVGIELYDRKGKLVDLNKSCLEMFGVSSIDAVKDFDLFDDPNIPPDQLSKLRKGESVKYESVFDFDLVKSINLYETTKTGKFYVNVLITPLYLEEIKSISNYLVQVQDITDNKIIEQKLKDINEELENKFELTTLDLKQSEERFKLLYENAPLSYQSLDYKGNILEVNKTWLDFFGYSKDEVIGRWFGDFIAPDYLNVLDTKFPKFKEEGEIKGIEYEMIKKDGSHAIVAFNGKISYDENGYFKQTHCIFRDITEQRKAEQLLKESEEKYRLISEDSEDLIVIYNERLAVEYLNEKTHSRILGYPSAKFKDNIFRGTLIHEEDLPDTARAFQMGYREGKYTHQFRLKNSNGIYLWFEVRGKIFIDKDGKKKILCVSRDITEIKSKEKELKDSEEKFRMLFNNINDAIVIVDMEGKVIECNQTSYERLGYTKEEFLNMTPMDFDTPQYAEGVLDRIQGVLQEGASSYEVDHMRKDGKIVPVEINSIKINFQGKTAILSVARDITERKKAEKELKDSEAKYRSIIDNSGSNIFVYDKDGFYEFVNKQAAESFGRKPENFVQKSLFDLFSRDLVEEYLKINQKIIESGIGRQYERTFDIENEPRTFLINDQAVKDSEGKGIYIVSSSVDITERKLIEQRLKESEEKYRLLFNNFPIGIGLSTIEGQVIDYNEAMGELTGYTKEELNKLGIPAIYTDQNEPSKAVNLLREFGKLRDYEIKFKRKDNTEFYGSLSLDLIEIKGVEIIQSTLKDITEKKEAELELIRLNNLKSELLRRTSHELKTPLVSIKGFSDLLLEVHRDKLDDYVVSTIDEIKQGCLRLEALISDILKTSELESGAIELKKSREDLSFLIRLCVNEVRGFSDLRNQSIELEIHEKVELDFEKEQIHQVISNLLNNAIKYTPRNGKIQIKSQIQNENISISVKDNGIGLSLNDRNQLFKQFGKIERFGQGLDVIPDGSGLGLYISKKIIELHGGEIWVESEGMNRGSTFYFTLPLH